MPGKPGDDLRLLEHVGMQIGTMLEKQLSLGGGGKGAAAAAAAEGRGFVPLTTCRSHVACRISELRNLPVDGQDEGGDAGGAHHAKVGWLAATRALLRRKRRNSPPTIVA